MIRGRKLAGDAPEQRKPTGIRVFARWIRWNSLIGQEATRVSELVPIRHGRMAASAFAFYRGAALPMAADLSATPNTGLNVQLCGDAHLANFGGFASPERDLVFDINDFDETAVGPFEWDVKRLAASVEIAGRELGYPDRVLRAVVLDVARTYRQMVRFFAAQQSSMLGTPVSTPPQSWNGGVRMRERKLSRTFNAPSPRRNRRTGYEPGTS